MKQYCYRSGVLAERSKECGETGPVCSAGSIVCLTWSSGHLLMVKSRDDGVNWELSIGPPNGYYWIHRDTDDGDSWSDQKDCILSSSLPVEALFAVVGRKDGTIGFRSLR